MSEEKSLYKNCTMELVDHFLKRCTERKVSPEWIVQKALSSKWCPHLIDERRTCIFRDGGKFWTIIVALEECHIFILTVYESTYNEIAMYKTVR